MVNSFQLTSSARLGLAFRRDTEVSRRATEGPFPSAGLPVNAIINLKDNRVR